MAVVACIPRNFGAVVPRLLLAGNLQGVAQLRRWGGQQPSLRRDQRYRGAQQVGLDAACSMSGGTSAGQHVSNPQGSRLIRERQGEERQLPPVPAAEAERLPGAAKLALMKSTRLASSGPRCGPPNVGLCPAILPRSAQRAPGALSAVPMCCLACRLGAWALAVRLQGVLVPRLRPGATQAAARARLGN